MQWYRIIFHSVFERVIFYYKKKIVSIKTSDDTYYSTCIIIIQTTYYSFDREKKNDLTRIETKWYFLFNSRFYKKKNRISVKRSFFKRYICLREAPIRYWKMQTPTSFQLQKKSNCAIRLQKKKRKKNRRRLSAIPIWAERRLRKRRVPISQAN